MCTDPPPPQVARASGRAARVLAVLSTHALLLLDARSLRLKRRLPARNVYRLSLSPHRDDLLVVHVRAVRAHTDTHTHTVRRLHPTYRNKEEHK